MNLIERIIDEMQSDCSNTDNESATLDEKGAIDKAIIALCGWSLNSLINMEG